MLLGGHFYIAANICELEDKILSETLLNLALNRKMDELIFTSKNWDPL